MRRACGLSLTAAGMLAAVVAAQPAAPPAKLALPPPTVLADPGNLKNEVEKLAKERADALKEIPGAAQTSVEREVQRQRLFDMLKRINDRKPSVPIPGPMGTPPSPDKDNKGVDVPPLGRAVDLVKAGENYYRAGEFDAALRTFRQVDRSLLAREDRAFVQYMLGCCLRKTGRRTDAAQVYREVAEAREDEFLSECAIWQLSLIRNSQELEAQLEQLRPRPKTR